GAAPAPIRTCSAPPPRSASPTGPACRSPTACGGTASRSPRRRSPRPRSPDQRRPSMMTTSDAVNDPAGDGSRPERRLFDDSAAGRARSVICADGTERTIPPRRWRFVVYSAMGLAMFFVTVEIGGSSTILVDHALTAVMTVLGPAVPWVVVALVLLGTVRPFATGS